MVAGLKVSRDGLEVGRGRRLLVEGGEIEPWWGWRKAERGNSRRKGRLGGGDGDGGGDG